jgi:hypothetical protein
MTEKEYLRVETKREGRSGNVDSYILETLLGQLKNIDNMLGMITTDWDQFVSPDQSYNMIRIAYTLMSDIKTSDPLGDWRFYGTTLRAVSAMIETA